ncbi:hypothetical protein NAU58_17955 [Pseudomonas stutzeri]|uniref:Uncharacterized protein n=1 Tax=Stutzerimonas stutzeri TaxID=316 RepID=A0A2N8RZ06_STUST|nr:hypothetical protein [Stutzerimonas stutzeri]MCQ4297465.1 hypothetical protein [Stutzerimonas stutzeri]PNF79603.1 hypothetical protein CXK92_13210 [Stutzerimonas stutzeri]
MEKSAAASATEAIQGRFKSSEEWVRQEENRDAELERSLTHEWNLKAWKRRQLRFRVQYFLLLNVCIAIAVLGLDASNSNYLDHFLQSKYSLIAAIILYLCSVIMLFVMPYRSFYFDSFSEIDRRHQESKAEMSTIAEAKVDELADVLTQAIDQATETISTDSKDSKRPEFDHYLKRIISDLDKQISLSDEKASKLLDKGVGYLGAGLFFYIISILFWQFWARGDELSAVVALGMFSCTITFVVIEFLAAWFLKQYRSFIDSSLSYARVKSHYDRCLLSYYALREFSSTAEDSAVLRSEMLEYLKREAHWPDAKQINDNDFNYMLESMNSITSAVDKFRGLVKKPKKVNVKEPS